MLRYLVLARRRVPALRRGHAIVLLSEENVFRARQTFAARGGDRPWTFPHGFISTQGVRGHHCRSVLCSGFPWKHRSIYRTPRGIWVGDGHGSARPPFPSTRSPPLGAFEYRRVDSTSTVLRQTPLIAVRSHGPLSTQALSPQG